MAMWSGDCSAAGSAGSEAMCEGLDWPREAADDTKERQSKKQPARPPCAAGRVLEHDHLSRKVQAKTTGERESALVRDWGKLDPRQRDGGGCPIDKTEISEGTPEV